MISDDDLMYLDIAWYEMIFCGLKWYIYSDRRSFLGEMNKDESGYIMFDKIIGGALGWGGACSFKKGW